MSTRLSISLLLLLNVLACEQAPENPHAGGGAGGSLVSGGEGGSGGAGGAGAAGGAGGASGAAGTMTSGGEGGGSAGLGGAGGEGGEAGGASGAGGQTTGGAGGAGGEASGGASGASGTGGPQAELGPCCETHEGPGCQDQATAECVCAMIPTCCTDAWAEECVIMVTQKHCEEGVRSCVCGEWELDGTCCKGEWPDLCQSTAVLKCEAKESCF